MTDVTVSARVDTDIDDRITAVSDDTGLSRSEVIRRALDNGLRAHKYYDEFEINP